MNNTPNQDSLEHRVLIEQIQLLYRSMVPMLIINLLVSVMLAYTLQGIVPDSTLIIWMGLMLAMLMVRAVVYVIYRQRYSPEAVDKYSSFLVIGSAVAGLIWGIGGAVMVPTENLEYQLFILFVLLGMGIGSTSSLSIYLPAFFAFFPLLMIPTSIRLILMDG